MKDRVLCRYGREYGCSRWDLWFVLSVSQWENGCDFPEGDPAFEYRDVYISVNNDTVNNLLNTLDLDIDAEIENVSENQ